MRILQNQKIESFRDRDSSSVFSNIEFIKCDFQGCALSITRDPALRTVVRGVKLTNCSQRGCTLHAAIVEDSIIEGFKTNGQLFQSWGAVFNRVTLQGDIDRIMVSGAVLPGVLGPDEQRSFDDSNDEYYKKVEWALDISKGNFKELCIRGVPGHLIRRDRETQVLVTREKALTMKWKKLEFRLGILPTSLDMFLQRQESSTVLVAPKRDKHFGDYLHDLNLLRKAGLAE